MDEVPIPNNNPVFIKPKQQETKKKPKKYSRILETFKNFIFMFPLALLICYQMHLLGYSFGEFITFPPTSVVTYIFIGSLLLMLFVIQIMMRSIVYSVAVGIVFFVGILSAWFGEVYDPIINNLSSVIDIIKSAWARKDIPFQLLLTGTLSGIFIAIVFVQFITSLLVKSFFEMVFGKNWGDGKWMGYLGAIALIFGIYISFNSYNKYSNNNKEKLLWKYFQQYNPMEKFITRTPGNITYNDEYIWINNGKKILAKKLSSGKDISERIIDTNVVCKEIEKSEFPIVATKDKFICLSNDLRTTSWEIYYPEYKIQNGNASETELVEKSEILIPLTFKFLKDGKFLISFYDYGMIGLYDLEKGKELWCEQIDTPSKVSRIFPEKYINDNSFLINNNKLIVACKNGYIKSVDLKTGKIEWIYQHNVSKIGGKPQRGFLSKNNDKNFIAGFRTGEIVSISYKDGHIVHRITNESFIINSPIYCENGILNFITEEGLFYQVELDGGNILNRLNALPNKADIYPIVKSNEHLIYAHREKIYKVLPDNSYSKLIFTCKNRTFITTPVFSNKTMYIGTQDGWIFCIHYGSESVKWVCHVDGELIEDSLKIVDDKLIVKSKSDSVFVFKKDYIQ